MALAAGYLPADEEAHSSWQAPNTLAVMRLATFAHQSGAGEQFARGLFQLAFGEGRDISQLDDAVVRVAIDCGAPPLTRLGPPLRGPGSSRRCAPLPMMRLLEA